MGDLLTIILEYVCPSIGVVLATQMFLAPYRDVQKAIRAGSLGELNPLPWVFMLGNCTGWILYSFLTRNFFLFAGNISGLILSIWFNLSASKLLFKQQVARLPDFIDIIDSEKGTDGTSRVGGESLQSDLEAIPEGNGDNGGLATKGANNKMSVSPSAPITELPVFYEAPVHDYRVMAMSLLWIVVFSIVGFADSLTKNTKELIVGSVTNFCLVFFYGAPLSSIAIVLKTHNTATLHVPTMFTNTASSVFWGVYGLGVMDMFVAVPNLLGALLGLAQILLYVSYPRVETTSVPVITAAIPAPGAKVGEDGTTEMEIVQVQLHDLATEDLLGQSDLLGNTNAGDPSNNPLNVAYGVPPDLNDPNSSVTTLHKHEITSDGVTATTTDNPLILRYGTTPSETMLLAGDTSNSRTAVLHRRTSSRGAGRLDAATPLIPQEREDGFRHETSAGPTSPNPPSSSIVASVHHRRVVSNGDSSFLAGLFASSRDILNVETTAAATLHRRVLSASNNTENTKENKD